MSKKGHPGASGPSQPTEGAEDTTPAPFSIALESRSNTIQLLPSGRFAATDGSGRPNGLEGWFINAEIAAELIEKIEQRKLRLPIDYEHQSFLAEKNGQPAPAAGWFRSVEWREGEGLFAVDVEWTDKAREMIKSGEYRYLSPVFTWNPETGDVTSLIGAGITNNPGLNNLAELSALTAKLATQAGVKVPDSNPIARLDALVKENLETMAALQAKTDEAATAQLEIATLRQKIAESEIDALIEDALDGARLLPAHVAAARRLASVDIAALKSLLDRPPLFPALLGMQSSRMSNRGGAAKHGGITTEERHICALTGRTPQQFEELKRTFSAEDSGLID
tara:strand:+ start:17091 stop:18101 length:1011 start_codon:yes stop_codon:yes gene_type:complete